MIFGVNDVKHAIGCDIAISQRMEDHIDVWWDVFCGKPPWLDKNTQTLGIGTAIASEMARLCTVELKSEISGGTRGDFLQEGYDHVLSCLREKVEYGMATGGMVFKPYIDKEKIVVDFVHAGRFVPTSFNTRGEITGAVFLERTQKGKHFFTRLEHHQVTKEGYLVRNTAYKSMEETALGRPISLVDVPEWCELTEEILLRYADGSVPERPLFAYFKPSFANHIDDASPLGVSVFGRAVNLLAEADRQYSRILWEYKGSELAIDAAVGALHQPSRFQKGTNLSHQGKMNGRPAQNVLPVGNDRLFRQLALDAGNGKDLYEVFSPEIRDTSLFNGLNQLLRRIEFACCLSYGTLSDPQNQEKTAEEVRMSKQKSYSSVCEMQKNLQFALEQLIWAMDFYTSLYKLAPSGEYEVSFAWGDGILTDTTVEYAQRKAMVDSGYLKKEKFLAWYFGISEEEAKEYLPENDGDVMF